MKAGCPRLFEVAAQRDGRLDGAEAVRFQSHLAVCDVCKREARALQALSEALRFARDFADDDELHVRRERTRLLAAFDASLVPAPRSRVELWRRSAVAVALLSALTALVFVFWPARPDRSRFREAPLARPPAVVTVRADSGARWSRQVEARLDKIILESGALSIRVDHAGSRRRLLVILPDGELEDIGTTFSVSADAGHTTRVTVQDGKVVLRLHGKLPIALGAGDSWSPPPAPAVMLREPTPPPTPARPVQRAAPDAVAPRIQSKPEPAPALPGVEPTPSATSAPQRITPDPAPSADFRAAVSAFESGDHARAAARFSVFLSQHPGDPRAEDAAYLRTLALQRSGNYAAMKQAAHDYLSRYPRGFRRAEVDGLLRHTATELQ